MTSFEPQTMGFLIDNMEYRRLCLDQAYQMQLQFMRKNQHERLTLLISNNNNNIASSSLNNKNNNTFENNDNDKATQQQLSNCIVAASTAAAITAVNAITNNSNSTNTLNDMISQIVAATTTSTLAQLKIRPPQQQQPSSNVDHTNSTTTANKSPATEQQTISVPPNDHLTFAPISSTSTTSASLRRYSILVNPIVYLISDDAASIAYTKLNHYVNIDNPMENVGFEQIQETRIWHKLGGDEKGWQCVHLHSSATPQPTQSTRTTTGPQLNETLMRHISNQQLATTLAIQQQQLQHIQMQLHLQQQQQIANNQQVKTSNQQQTNTVPIISLSNTTSNSTGSNSMNIGSSR